MTGPDIRLATPEDVLDLAPRMRFEDRREIWASSLMTPHRALMASLRLPSTWCWVARGKAQCMFGIVPAGSGHGTPWLLGSEDLPGIAFTFLRRSRPLFEAARRGYDVLVNHVDERNVLSKKWLQWLGFDILPPEPMGPFGLPFHRFEMRSK